MENLLPSEIIAEMPGHVYWKNLDSVYLGCNDYAAKMAGLDKKEDIVGKTDYDLAWKSSAIKIINNDREVIKKNQEIIVEERAKLSDGKLLVYISHKKPLRDRCGKTIGILGISLDISEQKEIEERLRTTKENIEERMKAIIDTTAGIHWWKDINGVYLGCNQAMVSALGLDSRENIIGKTDYELPWKAQAADLVKNDQLVISTGHIQRGKEENVTDNQGRIHTFIVAKSPIRDTTGNIIGTIGNSLDITAQKETEKQLRIAKEKAEVANIVKTNFIQNMEHDIRTPAGGIFALLDHMLHIEQEPQKLEILTAARGSAKQLLDLCNDVLDFDEIDRDTLILINKKLNVRNIVNDVVALNGAAALIKKLELSSSVAEDVPLILKSDEHRLRRILINLVGNAIKFTHEGSVNISVHLLKTENKTVFLEFEICDTGIGIPADQQDMIYEKFTRLSPSNKGHYKGVGLGLQVVKKFVEELEGEIEVQSEIGQGSAFYVTLPFEKPLNENIRD